MKKILMILTVALFATACSDLENIESAPVNLGAIPTSTKILSATTSGSKVTVKYNLTTGAKYSVQVYKFGTLDPIKTLPLTADSSIVTKVYEFTDLESGLYDLTLTDVAGATTKQPLIIKR